MTGVLAKSKLIPDNSSFHVMDSCTDQCLKF